MYMNMNEIEVIKKIVEKSLKHYKIKAKVRIEYRGSSLSVFNSNSNYNQDEYIFMWIRITKVGDRYSLDLSNINLPVNKQRIGVFQTLFDNLYKCKYVYELKITTVCSESMRNWCIKNNLREYCVGCFSKKKKIGN